MKNTQNNGTRGMRASLAMMILNSFEGNLVKDLKQNTTFAYYVFYKYWLRVYSVPGIVLGASSQPAGRATVGPKCESFWCHQAHEMCVFCEPPEAGNVIQPDEPAGHQS